MVHLVSQRIEQRKHLVSVFPLHLPRALHTPNHSHQRERVNVRVWFRSCCGVLLVLVLGLVY